MTTRTDVKVDFEDSPRIIEVASPSTEMTMQDLVDTLREQEDAFSKGLSHPKLIDASGKEPLGGGVSVGITTALQNALLSFEGRTTPAETGTVTTGSSTPVNGKISFIDTSADFVTAGVKRGSLVINFTDQSIADVVRVDSATQLTTKVLVNGVGNTYDVNDVYHVFNITQVNATGGNITAVDDVQAELDPLLPTAFTQVVRTSSASATIAELEITELKHLIEATRPHHSAFGDFFFVDATNGNDLFNGKSPERAFATITKALTEVSDWNNDVIFLKAGNKTAAIRCV